MGNSVAAGEGAIEQVTIGNRTADPYDVWGGDRSVRVDTPGDNNNLVALVCEEANHMPTNETRATSNSDLHRVSFRFALRL